MSEQIQSESFTKFEKVVEEDLQRTDGLTEEKIIELSPAAQVSP